MLRHGLNIAFYTPPRRLAFINFFRLRLCCSIQNRAPASPAPPPPTPSVTAAVDDDATADAASSAARPSDADLGDMPRSKLPPPSKLPLPPPPPPPLGLVASDSARDRALGVGARLLLSVVSRCDRGGRPPLPPEGCSDSRKTPLGGGAAALNERGSDGPLLSG